MCNCNQNTPLNTYYNQFTLAPNVDYIPTENPYATQSLGALDVNTIVNELSKWVKSAGTMQIVSWGIDASSGNLSFLENKLASLIQTQCNCTGNISLDKIKASVKSSINNLSTGTKISVLNDLVAGSNSVVNNQINAIANNACNVACSSNVVGTDTGNESGNGTDKKTEETFMQKYGTYLAIGGAVAVGAIVYKTQFAKKSGKGKRR